MNDTQVLPPLTSSDARRIDQTCDRFEAAWKAGRRPAPSDYLAVSDEPVRSALLRQLLLLDWDYRRRIGDNPRSSEYLAQFPDDAMMIGDLGREMSEAPVSTRVGRNTPWAGDGTAEMPEEVDAGPARYDLTSEIGHGGIGVVFRGCDRLLGRELAVKVLREDYRDRPDARRRFVAEARVGSQLQHPAIVPVYELGRFADGRPFITMKLVEGHTLAALLRERPDPAHDLPRFVSVFEQVCQAMAYAHNKGVVHRDLKPANVMVGAFGEVQVMDWGFAKAAGSKQQAAGSEEGDSAGPPVARCLLPADLTNSGALMGTPAYMPPEQARGEAALIDLRADVFALGAVLCEILTGWPPYAGSSADEVYRLAAAGDLHNAHARLDASGADATLRDLAKRCLTADRDRRPADAGAVARDVTAYLAQAQERLRQAQLDRAAADARATSERRARYLTLALAVALLVGAGVATWQAVAATRAKSDALTAAAAETIAKETANAKQAETRAVMNFFRDRVLEAARPKDDEGGLGVDATIRAALDKAEPQIAQAFAGQPVAEADIRHTMGLSYWHLGEFDRALQQTERALELQRQHLGPEDRETLGTLNNLGIVLNAMGKWKEARQIHEETLPIQRRVLGPENHDTLTSMHNLANVLKHLRQFDAARALYLETLALQRRVLGPENDHTLQTMHALADLLLQQGELEESRQLFEKTLHLWRRVRGPEHRNALAAMNGLAAVLCDLDRKEDARKVFEETLEIQRRVLTPEHPDTLRTMYNLANTLAELDRDEEAIALYRQTLELQHRVLGPKHFKTLRTMSALSQALDTQGQFEEARTLSEQAFRLRTEVLSPEHPETLISMHVLATVMYHQGQVAEARELLEKNVALRRRVLGPGHAHTLLSMNGLAWLLATASDPKFRDPPRAVELAKEVVERAPKDGDKWTTLGAALYRAGQWTDAIAALQKSEATAPGKPLAPNAYFLAMAHWQRGEKEEARRWFLTGAGRMAKTQPEDSDSLRCQAEAAKLLGLPNPL